MGGAHFHKTPHCRERIQNSTDFGYSYIGLIDTTKIGGAGRDSGEAAKDIGRPFVATFCKASAWGPGFFYGRYMKGKWGLSPEFL